MTQHLDHVMLAVRHLGTTVEISVSGEIDMLSAPAVRRRLAEALRRRPEIAVVDLREVAFIDSSGIHALLSSRSHAIAAGTQLVVIRPVGAADRVFTLSGLDEIFPPMDGGEGQPDSDEPRPAQLAGGVRP